MRFALRHGAERIELEVEEEAGGYRVSDGKRTWHVRIEERRGAVRTVQVDDARHRVGVMRKGEAWDIVLEGINHEFIAREARFEKLLELQKDRAAVSAKAEIRAPIPGLVTNVLKKAGDTVAEGEPVLILSAMKLENEIRSPRGGRVIEVRAKAGAAVEKGEMLAIVE
ncbi:MAG: biotin/lipoyl-binding protein [Planctomycetes bacterium]|nr:biotin/lipoyl-binding protein [Planctomycetota bacterium]